MSVIDEDFRMVLEHTRPLWEEMRGGRLFITGGTGFFGRWLLETFEFANRALCLNAEIVVLTRDPNSFQKKAPHLAHSPSVRLLLGDVRNFDFPAGNFTHLIHAASELSMAQPKDPLGLIETTWLGTKRVLDFANHSGVRKLLYTSSGAVYGPMVAGREAIGENDSASAISLDPRGAYAEAKRLAELVCSLFGKERGIEVKIARGFAFLGPFIPLDSHLAAANFLRSTLRGDPITIQGHGQTVRSYLYGADLAVWLWVILFRGLTNHPYNLGSDEPTTIAQLAEIFSRLSSISLPVQLLGKLSENDSVDIYLPKISMARDELGLKVFTPLVEAIHRTHDFYRQARKCYENIIPPA